MKNTKIEWATHTFNPWIGCSKVSPACTNCYAERDMSNKKNGVKWGAGNPRQRTSKSNWLQPVQWNKDATNDLGLSDDENRFNRPRVFCASLSDVFDDEVPIGWRNDLFELIERCNHLDWLLLTKRPENFFTMLPLDWIEAPRSNVWLGTSVENQNYADSRIPMLLQVPAAVHFISCEPLLGPVDITKLNPGSNLDWVITGGESGPSARQMNPAWARSLRDQTEAKNIAFLFKQWGEWDANLNRVGKIVAGRSLDGRTWDGYPSSVPSSEIRNDVI